MRACPRISGFVGRRTAWVALALMAGSVAAVSPAHAATAQCPWMNATHSPDQRAGELVAAMSTDQKISMLHSAEPTMAAYYGTAGHVAAIPSLCIPDLVLNDAGAGVADGQPRAGIPTCSSNSARASAGRRGTRAST